MSLQARLDTQDGIPSIVLERMNDTRLYVVGGISPGGITEAFKKLGKTRLYKSPLSPYNMTR
ncbi:MAG: hypothetical protein V3S14_14420 [Anaerolineae bacterium]